MYSFLKPTVLGLSALTFGLTVAQAVHPSRGLWVGEVALDHVNEATGAVGDSNTYEFTDPEIATPTSDTAYLRLIVHVNGAGQAFLLKSVAIAENGTLPDGSKDLVLLTDPTLYPSYPGLAKRIASAFYDFGDTQAVRAVDVIIDTVTSNAATRAIAGDVESAIRTSLETDLGVLVDEADVDIAYLDSGSGGSSFLTDTFFTEAEVLLIAARVQQLMGSGSVVSDFEYDLTSVAAYSPLGAPDPLGGEFTTIVTAATNLRDSTVYGDTRALAAIVGVVVAAAEAVAESAPADQLANAELAATAARHNAADVDQAYNQFIASSAFLSLLSDGTARDSAVLAAVDSESRGKTEAEIVADVTDALLADPTFQAAYTLAETIRSASLWGDTRARDAVDALTNKAAEAAAAQVLTSTDQTLLADIVTQALSDAFTEVDTGEVFASAPSMLYTDFVRGSNYSDAATEAASTAASEAFFQFTNGVTDRDDLEFFIRRSVSKALIGVRNEAAALLKSEVALSGELAADQSLQGEFILPALAPTNPFLHRLHPDHSEGIAITRRVSMTVDPVAATSGFETAGYGVSELSGVYEEELFGLHKPLGNAQDVGLKTKGRFTLNRLTLVETLNF